MFSANWTTPYNGEIKTLRLTKSPHRYGLGNYYDVDGVLWHVYAIHGEYVNARQAVGNYYSTAIDGGGYGEIHRWPPCKVEVVPTKDGG